jgi:hypothetical protein
MANREPVKRLQLMPQGVVAKYPCDSRSSRAGMRWHQIGTALLSVSRALVAGVARAVRAFGRLIVAGFRRMALGPNLIRIGRAAGLGLFRTACAVGRGMATIGRWLGRTVRAGMMQGMARLHVWSAKRAHQAELPAMPSALSWTGLTDNLYDSTFWQERSLVRNQALRHEIGVVRAHLAAQEKELARAAAHITRLRSLVRIQQQALEDAARDLHDRDARAEERDDLLISVTEEAPEQQFGRGRLF